MHVVYSAAKVTRPRLGRPCAMMKKRRFRAVSNRGIHSTFIPSRYQNALPAPTPFLPPLSLYILSSFSDCLP